MKTAANAAQTVLKIENVMTTTCLLSKLQFFWHTKKKWELSCKRSGQTSCRKPQLDQRNYMDGLLSPYLMNRLEEWRIEKNILENHDIEQ